MASEDSETTVTTEYSVSIPSAVRAAVDLEPGDRLRWDIDALGRLVAEIIQERRGVARDLEPVDMGETDAVHATDSYDWS